MRARQNGQARSDRFGAAPTAHLLQTNNRSRSHQRAETGEWVQNFRPHFAQSIAPRQGGAVQRPSGAPDPAGPTWN